MIQKQIILIIKYIQNNFTISFKININPTKKIITPIIQN